MIELSKIDAIIAEKGATKESLIPILQAVQREFHFLPEEALRRVSEMTAIKPAEIIGVASFYSQFRLAPVGEHIIRVCVGTACHVKGAVQVYDAMRREFKLKDGQKTDQRGKYTVEKVSCLGCCTLAPVVQIDNITYGHVTSDKTSEIIKDFESRKDDKRRKFFHRSDGTAIQGEVRIGLGSCCVASGSSDIRDAAESTINGTGLRVKLKSVGCVGMCHQVPLVEIVPVKGEATLYAKVKPEDVQQIITSHFSPAGRFSRFKQKFVSALENIQTDKKWEGIERYELDIREKHVSSFLGKQFPIATEYRGVINPIDLAEYKQLGGFEALRKVLTEFTPDQVIEKIKKAGEGPGFPQGLNGNL
jgi:NADH-quinone oxidoreductase subunit F